MWAMSRKPRSRAPSNARPGHRLRPGAKRWQARWRSPLGCIFGAEDQGIRPGLLKHADLHITLPMSGAELSYNVAVAVGKKHATLEAGIDTVQLADIQAANTKGK